MSKILLTIFSSMISMVWGLTFKSLIHWLSSINQQQVLMRMWRKGNPFALLVGMQTDAATVESTMEITSKTLKMDLPLDPAIPLLGVYPKEPKILIQKNISTPMFIAALFTITKIWKQPKCPSIDEWIKQPWDIYAIEYYSAIEKKKVLPFATVWMDLENIMLSEISQSEKDRYYMISLICGI